MHRAAAWQHSSSTSMELTLSRWGGLPTKQFQPERVNEKSSTELSS